MSEGAMHSQEEMDKVIARIQKLLARTKEGRGASEAEADTAMRLAQDMMAKYNLDMAVIEAAQPETSVERIKEEVKGRAMYKWQRSLAKYVAEANFCYHLVKADSKWINGHWSDQDPDDPDRDTGWGRDSVHAAAKGVKWIESRYKTTFKHVFVGRKANVITAQMMYHYLTEAVENLLPIKDNAQRMSRSATSWKEGCADRLCERLAKKRDDLIKQHDARARAEEKARQEEHAAKYKAKTKELPANEEAEVKSAISGLKATARDRSGANPDMTPETDQPEVNPDDTWTPGGEQQPEAPQSQAMVLASVYDDKEREANWEVAHGYEPGFLAKLRAEREEQQRKDAEEAAKTETDRIEKPVKDETERQRKARQRRELEQHMKDRRRWAREDAAAQRREEREWMKRDHSAYKSGAEAGKGIGLDLQIKSKADVKRLKE